MFQCIPYIDESVMSGLVPRLVELLRGGIGLGTKAGCANFIVSLTHQCPQLLTPHAGEWESKKHCSSMPKKPSPSRITPICRHFSTDNHTNDYWCKSSRNTRVDASELIDDGEPRTVALVLVKDFRKNIFY